MTLSLHTCVTILYGVKPFAALFWALGIVCILATIPDPARRGARHHFTAVHKACPNMVIVGSILNEEALPPFPLFISTSRYVICLSLPYLGI